MIIENQKTIVAISTPAGIGGVGIIRISGKNSLFIAQKIFSEKYELIPRYLKNIKIKTDSVSDSAMAVYFKSPNSFTGEDVIELHCHGNYLLLTKIVEELIKSGANLAEPGEFTKRAFINGKIDLSGAEGLIDLINAKSTSGINSALNQLNGGLANKIKKLQKELVFIIADSSAAIDYPEEDLEEAEINKITNNILPIIKKLEIFKNSFDTGRIIRDGVRVAIIGKPNVGKSLLLNRLLGFDRSIVTDTAGTTRDTIEENFNYKGIIFNLIDTAGLRNTNNEVEKLGIERSKNASETADILLCVGTIDEPFDKNFVTNNKKTILIYNKIDLVKNTAKIYNKNSISVSALTCQNIDKLKDELYNLSVGKIDASGVYINNNRQLTAVVGALEALERVKNAKNINLDCVISDLNHALYSLNTITGAVALDEVVNEIFANFCVGK